MIIKRKFLNDRGFSLVFNYFNSFYVFSKGDGAIENRIVLIANTSKTNEKEDEFFEHVR